MWAICSSKCDRHVTSIKRRDLDGMDKSWMKLVKYFICHINLLQGIISLQQHVFSMYFFQMSTLYVSEKDIPWSFDFLLWKYRYIVFFIVILIYLE